MSQDLTLDEFLREKTPEEIEEAKGKMEAFKAKDELTGVMLKNIEDSLVSLLNLPHLSYFGQIAYARPIKVLDKDIWSSMMQQDAEQEGTACACTDGENIFFLANDSITPDQINFVIVHEIMHVIDNHVIRRGNRDPAIWNIAIDHVVNRYLMPMAKDSSKRYFNTPYDCIFFEDIERSNPNVLPEELYEILMKQATKIPLPEGSAGCPGDGSGNGNSSSKSSGENYRFEYTEEEIKNPDGSGTGKVKVTVKDKKTGKTHTIIYDKNEKKKDIEKNKELRDKAKGLWTNQGGKLKGYLPGDFVSFIEDAFLVEIPWEDVLEDAILYSAPASTRRSWVMPNFYIRNVKVPGKNSNRTPYYMYVGLDSSGSMSDDDLRTAIGILMGSARHFKSLYVIVHDVYVVDEIDITTLSEHSIFEKLSAIKGRGGTSHREIFDLLEDRVQEEKVSSILFFTDYYSDVERIYKNYKFLKDYPTCWILNSDLKVNLGDCSHQVIRINTDNRYKY